MARGSEKAGRRIERIAVAFEAALTASGWRAGSKARGIEAYVIHASSVACLASIGVPRLTG